jgi:hypothetical protein
MLPIEAHSRVIADFLAERQSEAVRLRLALVSDAPFLLSLRLDPSRNQNISATANDLNAQMEWMRAYGLRHSAGGEAYFLIEAAGVPQGSLRLYDYRQSDDSYCWGSWIIRPGAPPAIAFSSLILAYDMSFGPLQFTKARFEVRQANLSVWKFHEALGAKMVREDGLTRYYEYMAPDYAKERPRLKKFAQLKVSE